MQLQVKLLMSQIIYNTLLHEISKKIITCVKFMCKCSKNKNVGIYCDGGVLDGKKLKANLL